MNCIVILNYNNWVETRDYVLQICDYQSLNKIVVVDNFSSDGSYLNLLPLSNERVHVIQTNENRGYNFGNNYGVRYAIKEFKATNIIISNPDIEVSDDCIYELCKELDGNKNCAVMAPLVYNRYGKMQSNCGWNLPSYFQMLMNSCLLTYKLLKILGKSNYFSPDCCLDELVPVEAVSGCFFAISKDAYCKIEGFDERTFLYGEEILLGFSLKKNGKQMYINKKCKVIHYDRGSQKKDYRAWKKTSKLIKDAHVLYLENYLNVGKIRVMIYEVIYAVGNAFNRIIVH